MSEPNEELIAYLLDELGDEDRHRLEARLRSEPDLAAELAETQQTIRRLREMPAEAWQPPEPPPLTLPVSDIPAGRPDAGGSPVRTSWLWSLRRRWIASGLVAGMAVAIAAVLIFGTGGEAAPEAPASSTIALRPVDDGDRSAAGELTRGELGRATLAVSGLAPSGDDFYEVWLLGESGLVSLGSFTVPASGEAEADLWIPVEPSAYRSYDVSLEPADGDPRHSGESVLRAGTRT